MALNQKPQALATVKSVLELYRPTPASTPQMILHELNQVSIKPTLPMFLIPRLTGTQRSA
jgi:hypothetical protein